MASQETKVEETVAEMVRRTRAEQGLPPKVTDRATLERIVRLAWPDGD